MIGAISDHAGSKLEAVLLFQAPRYLANKLDGFHHDRSARVEFFALHHTFTDDRAPL